MRDDPSPCLKVQMTIAFLTKQPSITALQPTLTHPRHGTWPPQRAPYYALSHFTQHLCRAQPPRIPSRPQLRDLVSHLPL